ncbi:MAG: Gfo/Idh/MocA family oxidoreductase [Balneolaceae bacterium]
MNIAIIGCGYVSDFYFSTLKDYPDLNVCGIYDKKPERMALLSKKYGHPVYSSLEELLSDDRVKIVLNLTNPDSHYEINRLILEADKHVYSEKPLSMKFDEAEELYNLAKARGLQIVSAPCSLLGEQAQTMWKALREKLIGDVWVVYAEMDEGPVHLMEPEKWTSASGIPWPVNDEFEVGCTLEHAGYYLPWLVAWFGPAKHVNAFSSCRIMDKQTSEPLNPDDTPDFSVAAIKFESGVVARLTCSIMGEHNHELKVYGEKGVIALDECWNYGNPVRVQYYNKRAMNGQKHPYIRKNPVFKALYGISWEKLPFVRKPDPRSKWQGRRPSLYFMDFSRGVHELAQSIREKRDCRLSSELSLHINELALAIQNAGEQSGTYKLKTTCGPVEPMEWAQ